MTEQLGQNDSILAAMSRMHKHYAAHGINGRDVNNWGYEGFFKFIKTARHHGFMPKAMDRLEHKLNQSRMAGMSLAQHLDEQDMEDAKIDARRAAIQLSINTRIAAMKANSAETATPRRRRAASTESEDI